jgi:hypothetical protein
MILSGTAASSLENSNSKNAVDVDDLATPRLAKMR